MKKENNNNLTDDIFGDYLKMLPKKVLTKEEEYDLFELYNTGNDEQKEYAKKILVEYNLRLVVTLAKQYMNTNIDIIDIIQEGNIGLIAALEKFDYQKGTKFSTYSQWTISAYISRYVIKYEQPIRLPEYIYEDLNRLNNLIKKHIMNTGKKPSYEELAKKTGYSIGKIIEILAYNSNIISLNDKINNEDENNEHINFVKDRRVNIEGEFIKTNFREEIIKIILETEELSFVEKKYLFYRYGFVNNRVYTAKEAGEILGVERSKYLYYEKKILNVLRRNAEILKYINYLDDEKKCMENLKDLSSQKNDGKIKKYYNKKTDSKKKKITRYASLFEKFNEYTKEEVYAAVASLSESDKELLFKKYDSLLFKKEDIQLTDMERKLINTIVASKLSRRLATIRLSATGNTRKKKYKG